MQLTVLLTAECRPITLPTSKHQCRKHNFTLVFVFVRANDCCNYKKFVFFAGGQLYIIKTCDVIKTSNVIVPDTVRHVERVLVTENCQLVVIPDTVRHVERVLVTENCQLIWSIVFPEAVNTFIVIMSLDNHYQLLLL